MKSITETEYSSMTEPCLSGTVFVTKIISGINEICVNLGVSPLNSRVANYDGTSIFNACEEKLKQVMLKIGTSYPSDEAVVGRLPFGSFPKLPSFRDVGRGTETVISPGGVVGFAFGLFGWGISSAIRAQKKAEMRKKNRITNFVLVYNALIQRFRD
jgi:hypothetical protein